MTIGIIYCYTNKITGKKYIGQTIRPRHRQITHKHSALQNKTQSIFHRSVRKHGWDAFDYEVLTECEEENLTEMEAYFITEMKTLAPMGYNQLLGSNMTLEVRKKNSNTQKKRYSEMSFEERQDRTRHLWESRIGTTQTDYQKHKVTEANQKRWQITTPEGQILEIVNLNRFCKEHNIGSGNMVNVSKGKLPHTKGYKCIKLDP